MNIYHITGMWCRCSGRWWGDRTQALDFPRNTSHLRSEARLIIPVMLWGYGGWAPSPPHLRKLSGHVDPKSRSFDVWTDLFLVFFSFSDLSFHVGWTGGYSIHASRPFYPRFPPPLSPLPTPSIPTSRSHPPLPAPLFPLPSPIAKNSAP